MLWKGDIYSLNQLKNVHMYLFVYMKMLEPICALVHIRKSEDSLREWFFSSTTWVPGGVELRKLSASAYLFGPHLFSRQDLVMESGVALTSQQFSCFKLLRAGMTGMTTIVVTRSYKQPSFYFCYAGDRA